MACGKFRGGSDKTSTTPSLWFRLWETLDSQHRKKINSPHSSQKVQRELHKPKQGDKGTAVLGRGRSHHTALPKLLQGLGFSTRTNLPSTATTPPQHICRNRVLKIPVPKLTESLTVTNPGRNSDTRASNLLFQG